MSEEKNEDLAFLTIDEVAEGLRVSKVTIYRLVESGQLKSYKIKGCVRISEDDLLRFIKKCKRPSDIT